MPTNAGVGGHMVGRVSLALLAIALAVAGCYDRFYGPRLTNGFGFDVVVTVDYDVGRSTTTRWPACRTVFFGSKQQVVTRLVMEKDGKTLQALSAAEVRELARALEDSRGRANWIVDTSGVHRTSGETEISCKPPESAVH